VGEYRKEYPVSVLCDTLGVSLSGYYAWKKRPMSRHQREDTQLAEHIHAVYHACRQVYGSPRIHALIAGSGPHHLPQTGGSPHARTGIVCWSSSSSDDHDKKRAWSACRPQCVGSRFYRDPSIGRSGRAISRRSGPTKGGSTWQWCWISIRVGSLDGRWLQPRTKRSLRGLSRWRYLVDIHQRECCAHSDRGSQYTSDAYQALLADVGATVSMSRTGNCYDNAVTESFFGTFKGECVERTSFQTRGQARQIIFEYVECFYNRVRRHSSLGYVSPAEYEQVVS
jgi:putative transposase